jgi:hypothetical protein
MKLLLLDVGNRSLNQTFQGFQHVPLRPWESKRLPIQELFQDQQVGFHVVDHEVADYRLPGQFGGVIDADRA